MLTYEQIVSHLNELWNRGWQAYIITLNRHDRWEMSDAYRLVPTPNKDYGIDRYLETPYGDVQLIDNPEIPVGTFSVTARAFPREGYTEDRIAQYESERSFSELYMSQFIDCHLGDAPYE